MNVLWQLKTGRESYLSEIHVKTGTTWRCYLDTGVRNREFNEISLSLQVRLLREAQLWPKVEKLVFLYCSWGSHSRYSGVVCHSLLQGTTFCQKSTTMTCLPWVALHGMACSFIELCRPLRLDKAV